MLQFIRDNIFFVLTIVGALISFLVTFIGLVAKKKPVVVLAVLAVLGFTLGIAYQVFNYNLKQEEARNKAAKAQMDELAQKVRDNVINEINLTVQQTKITVEAIAAQLTTTTMQEVGTELVSISTSGNIHFEETVAFAKGSPEMWHQFADWLASVTGTKVAASLSLTFNSNHHYDSGLLLAYLLTSEATRDSLRSVIERHAAWHDFPAEQFFQAASGRPGGRLQWVLFYDAATQQLAAFAEAKAFTQELMVFHRLKQHDKINALLNASHPNTITELQKAFPSVQTAVFATQQPAELVKLMIDQQLSVSVASTEKVPYVAKLVDMIQVAAKY